MSANGIVAKPVTNPVCPKCGAALPAGGAPLSETTCPGCGAAIMVPGMLAGKYRLTRLVGAGGMGAVYEAVDEGLERKVAVKVILKEKAAEDPDFLVNFKKEAIAASRFQDAHIVSIYDSGEESGQPYLVMEMVEPDSLDRMMKGGPVMPAKVLDVGIQIAQGLKAAADAGMVHGDVKPENILINERREAKLADFGIAALMGAHAAANNEVWGTPYYIAPETLRKQKVDFRADMYSLGGTLYHAIAGVPPFEGADAVEVMKGRLLGPARPLREVAPSCPEGIEKIIMRMLEAEPGRRFPNYDALINEMNKELRAVKSQIGGGKRIVLKGATISTPSRPMPSVINAPLTPEHERKGLSGGVLIGIAAGAAFLVIACIVAIVAVMMGGGEEPAPADAPVPEAAVAAEAEAAPEPSAESRAALVALSEAAAKRAADVTARRDQAATIAERLAKSAKGVTAEADAAWLEPKEGEAPNEALKALQTVFAKRAALDKAVEAAAAARKTIDGERTKAEAPEATADAVEAALKAAQAAEKAYAEHADVKAAAGALEAVQDINQRWARLHEAARKALKAAQEAAKEAERKAAEEAAKQAAEEQRRQEIEREVGRVQSAANAYNVTRALDRFAPAEAIAALEKSCPVDKLRFDESKEAAQVARERIAVLQHFREWLTKAASEGRLGAFKITAADDKGITIGGAKIKWEDLVDGNNRNQIVPLIMRGIADEAGARTIGLSRPSQRQEAALGAYFFLERYCGDLLGVSKSLRAKHEVLRTLIEGTSTFKRLQPAAEGGSAE